MQPTSAADEGFTLLEVLVAFAVTATFAAALASVVLATGRTAERAAYVQATRVAAETALVRAGRSIPLEEGIVRWQEGRIAVALVMQADRTLAGLWHLSATAEGGRVRADLATSVYQP